MMLHPVKQIFVVIVVLCIGAIGAYLLRAGRGRDGDARLLRIFGIGILALFVAAICWLVSVSLAS
ncbi:MAG TPA: hypothetical protein VGK90_04960 [Rhizomicrobium sp.]|jgi:hypothetical protein